MNDLLNLADRNLDILNELIRKTQDAIDKAPPGSLRICKRNGRLYYYQRMPGSSEHVIYIPKDNTVLPRELAQKDYNIKLLKALNERLAAIEKLCVKFPHENLEDIYESLTPERKELVSPVMLTNAQYVSKWLAQPYTGLPFKIDDNSSYFTENNERVRSKSEIIIANTLLHAGIPYKYECPLNLAGKVIYPDFTILDVKNRHIMFLEHFGMMDNPEYANEFVRKINFYEINGIFPGKNLMMTFESSLLSLNTAIVKLLIENSLL